AADDYYDIVGVHFYDNPQMLEEVIAFLEARQLVSKPIWLTELGFVNQSSAFNVDDQGRWLTQKMVIALSNGVEQSTYSPVMASLAALTSQPIFDGSPGSPSWRPAAYASQAVGNAIGESSGYTFYRKRTVGSTLFYEYAHQDGQHHEAFAWLYSGSANV